MFLPEPSPWRGFASVFRRLEKQSCVAVLLTFSLELTWREKCTVKRMILLDPALITTKVTATLEKHHIRYIIVGSLASTLHGMVRTTQDSDIVAEMLSEHVD